MGAINSNTQQNPDSSFDITQDWQVISDRKSTKYLNKISGDQYVLKMVNFSPKEENAFKMRQFYSFEHNPRVVILLQSSSFIQFLIEDAQTTLKSWLNEKNLCQSELLIMLRTVMNGFKNLHQKYGAFYITEKMIKINKKGRILLWINEKFESNQIDYKLPEGQGQQTMLSQILKLFSDHLQGLGLQSYNTFEKSINYIQKIFMTNFLRETNYTDQKIRASFRIGSQRHTRKQTDQFKSHQAMNNSIISPGMAEMLRISDQSRDSSLYGGSKRSEKNYNPEQNKKNKNIFSTTPRKFLSDMNSSELVQSATEGSSERNQTYLKLTNSNKGKKYQPHQFQMVLDSPFQDHGRSFEMRRNDKAPMQTINEVSKSNISKSELDSPSIGMRLKRADSGQQISSPEIRKIRAQLSCLL